MPGESNENEVDIAILGYRGCGVTSLCLAVSGVTFNAQLPPTNAEYTDDFEVKLQSGKATVTLTLAGTDPDHPHAGVFLGDKHGVIFVYDQTDPASLNRLKDTAITSIFSKHKVKQNDNDFFTIKCFLVGTKCDVKQQRGSEQVTDEDINSFITELRKNGIIILAHHKTSAKTGAGINELLSSIAGTVLADDLSAPERVMQYLYDTVNWTAVGGKFPKGIRSMQKVMVELSGLAYKEYGGADELGRAASSLSSLSNSRSLNKTQTRYKRFQTPLQNLQKIAKERLTHTYPLRSFLFWKSPRDPHTTKFYHAILRTNDLEELAQWVMANMNQPVSLVKKSALTR